MRREAPRRQGCVHRPVLRPASRRADRRGGAEASRLLHRTEPHGSAGDRGHERGRRMMDGEAISELYEKFSRPEIREGRVFTPAGWTEAKPDHHTVTSLHVGTLTGFVDYVEANKDALPLASCVA